MAHAAGTPTGPPRAGGGASHTAWFVRAGGRALGPLDPSDLRRRMASGQIRPDTLLARNPEGPWLPAHRGWGLFGAGPSPRVPGPSSVDGTPGEALLQARLALAVGLGAGLLLADMVLGPWTPRGSPLRFVHLIVPWVAGVLVGVWAWRAAAGTWPTGGLLPAGLLVLLGITLTRSTFVVVPFLSVVVLCMVRRARGLSAEAGGRPLLRAAAGARDVAVVVLVLWGALALLALRTRF